MNRYLFPQIQQDLKRKMVFVTGPRQVGKTFLAKALMAGFNRPQYYNYDQVLDAEIIRKQSWPVHADLIIFDEIHKMKNWKRYLKGVFDTRSERQALLVTGSSRMETFRQSGESLAGRYFHYHLFPLSVRELATEMKPFDALEALMTLGGFPEPFLSASEEYAAKWRQQYYADLIREDILEFSRIHEVKSMKVLLELLRGRVGSPLSVNSLSRDLQISPTTTKKYIDILESLYIIFLVHPYHRNIARAILREPKLYFYDSGFVQGDEGKRLENAVAVSLLKHVTYLRDVKGQEANLHFVRTKEGKEVDFSLSVKDKVTSFIEVKLSEDAPGKALAYLLSKSDPQVKGLQLVHQLRREKETRRIQIRSASQFLSELEA